MDVEDLILIRGFSKLAICRSRLTARGAGGGKDSFGVCSKAHWAQPLPCSPQHPQRHSPLFEEVDLLLLGGKMRWPEAQRGATLHTQVLQTQEQGARTSPQRTGIRQHWDADTGSQDDRRVGTVLACRLGCPRVYLAPPAWAWGGCTSAKHGLEQGAVG